MSVCELNKIFLGEVAAVQNYGAFIKIPGSRQQGLLHKSQICTSRVDDVGEVLQRGEQVWCKVISVTDDGKVGLSMKHVHQGTGTDLDPNGVQSQREEQRRRTAVVSEKKVIALEAVFNTTCTRCGTKGHLAKDCFSTPDGKKYDLLPETDDEPVPVPVVEQVPSRSKPEKDDKKSKSKKVKKRKKSKKSRHKSDTSSSDSSSEEERKRKKKKKHSKESKRKKRKRSESSSDDSSDNGAHEKHSKKCKHSRSKHSD